MQHKDALDELLRDIKERLRAISYHVGLLGQRPGLINDEEGKACRDAIATSIIYLEALITPERVVKDAANRESIVRTSAQSPKSKRSRTRSSGSSMRAGSENTELVRQLRERIKFLEEKTQAQEAALGHISHDFRNALGNVSKFVSLIRRHGFTNYVAFQEHVEHLDSALRVASAIAERALAHLRSDHGGVVGQTVAEVGGALSDALTVLRPDQIDTKAAVRIEGDTSLKVQCDQARLSMGFQNVIANSIKYRKPGTRPDITVVVEMVPGGWVHVAFIDRGTTIDPSTASKLFDQFYRGSAAQSGDGMGLYNVKTTVVCFGGEVWAEPGTDGTEIHFKLRLVDDLPKRKGVASEGEARHNADNEGKNKAAGGGQ